MSIASPLPVGSAKFGPRVGANVVGARVGGLVSPTLVGAGVPVGTGVGAAHAQPVPCETRNQNKPQPQCARASGVRFFALGFIGGARTDRVSTVEYP